MSITHNLPLAPEYQDAPELMEGLNLFFGAWLHLIDFASGDRVPFTDAKAYADEYEFTAGQRLRLFDYIGALNSSYATLMSKKRKAAEARAARNKERGKK